MLELVKPEAEDSGNFLFPILFFIVLIKRVFFLFPAPILCNQSAEFQSAEGHHKQE